MSQFSHLAHQLKPADWVQLFGTIASASLAVGGALIGVNLGNKNARKIQQEEADHQLERDRQTEAVRLNAMLQALREELSVSWNIYVVQVGQSVENAANDKQKPLPFWPCYGDYFVVFKANAANLGMIKTDDLRKALVAPTFLQKVILRLIRPSIAFWRTTIMPTRRYPRMWRKLSPPSWITTHGS